MYQLSLAIHHGICGALFLALRVVGLGGVLIADKNTLNDTVTQLDIRINKYLLRYLNYEVKIRNVSQI